MEEGGAKSQEISARRREVDKEMREREERAQREIDLVQDAYESFRTMTPKALVESEQLWRAISDRYEGYFQGGMGAEAVKSLLDHLDLDAEMALLQEHLVANSAQKRQRATQRLKVVRPFWEGKNRPRDLILETVPVIPPDLRPMVQLDGGRFATSDLNDLYRRVINRNNRLKRLLDLGAPEIIVNNEKRMLQEAVDALFDNGRRGRAVTGPGNRALKSLSDMLKGKQGRFRQNLLGKRVDYSGRSVIVVGPQLKLNQCGLPKVMALELFKPFVMKRLVDRDLAQNIKSAKRMVERQRPQVWDVLSEVIQEHPGAAEPGADAAPSGYPGFRAGAGRGQGNSDPSDGLRGVQRRLRRRPDGGPPAVVGRGAGRSEDPDVVDQQRPSALQRPADHHALPGHGHRRLLPVGDGGDRHRTRPGVRGRFGGHHGLRPRAAVPPRSRSGCGSAFWPGRPRSMPSSRPRSAISSPMSPSRAPKLFVTTLGRALINQAFPEDFPFIDHMVAKADIGRLIEVLIEHYPRTDVATTLDAIKDLGFRFATRAGLTIGLEDVKTPENKAEILAEYEARADKVQSLYQKGVVTEEERRQELIEIWTEATDKVKEAMEANLKMEKFNPLDMMVGSGARGNMLQVRQIAGMRGLVANPKGDIIPRPIVSNFREGLSVLEYFISTHGVRKGLADTALRTADSGYLTRRLVDVSQEVIIKQVDCETDRGIRVSTTDERGRRIRNLRSRVFGRVLADDIKVDKKLVESDDVKLKAGTLIGTKEFQLVEATEAIPELRVRSPLTCDAPLGICQSCYGLSLATGKVVEVGEAVGIMAAQSIGEPGTQLTMRTFHTGGVAGEDITHGLPRVVELFEARTPKGKAIMAEVGGPAQIVDDEEGRRIVIDAKEGEAEYPVSRRARLRVTDGDIGRARHPADRGSSRSQGGPRDSGRACLPAVPGRPGPGGLSQPGRRDPRQAHRADRSSDASPDPGGHPR